MTQYHPALMLLLALFGSPKMCRSWGQDSHRVISKLAIDLAGKPANQLINNLLGDEDFVESSLWADTALAESRYPMSSSYHFSHTPYRNCAAFDFSRDCGFHSSGLCLVSGISRFLSVVVDPFRSHMERQEALKFIVHLVGDMHQPLHTGFRQDAGGTSLNVTNPDKVTLSLHEVFDFDIIARYKSLLKPPHWESVAAKTISMIQNTPGAVARYTMTANLTRYLENEDMMMEYAAAIVSEMTTTVTCNYAYRNENGAYIENQDQLSPAFYKSRTSGVLTLMIKAGVRLAKLLDAIAVEYNRRKSAKDEIEYEDRIARAIAEPSHAPASGPHRDSSNRFAVLAIDFDPETLCEEDDDDDAPEENTSLPRGDDSSPVKKKRKIAQKHTSALLLHELILYEGVDLDHIVLIRRKGKYFVTDDRIVKSHKYSPLTTIAFNVRLKTTGEVKLLFDMSVFPSSMTDELAIRTILRLNGIHVKENETVESYVTGLNRDSAFDYSEMTGSEKVRSGFTVTLPEGVSEESRKSQVDFLANLNTRLKAEHALRQKELERKFSTEWSKKFATISQYMESQIKAKRSQVVVISHDRMQMFVLVETLKRPITGRCRFNFIPVQLLSRAKDDAVKTGILIDPDLFEGLITSEIWRLLQVIERSNKSLSKSHKKTRPTLMEELNDAEMIFYGTDPDRMMKRKILTEFMVYPGDELSRYLVFEWALNKTMI